MSQLVFAHITSRKSAVVSATDEELADIRLAEKLDAAQAKYGSPMSTFSRNQDSRETIFAANTPDVDDIANLAVKFRFFYANKEPTQFEKIATKIRHRTNDEGAQNYIDRISDWHRTAMKQCDTSSHFGHPISNRRIIDLWFNSEFFHSATEKRAELQTIHEAIGEEPSLFQLYTAIAKCSSFINMLYVVVHKLEREHEYVYTPNHHFKPSA